MLTKTLLAAAVAAPFAALPAIAQTSSDTEKSGHHYQGGPKTESHHMGKKDTGGTTKKGKSGSHHYSGGPKTDVPHHIGPK